jgi:hypothetical protein
LHAGIAKQQIGIPAKPSDEESREAKSAGPARGSHQCPGPVSAFFVTDCFDPECGRRVQRNIQARITELRPEWRHLVAR